MAVKVIRYRWVYSAAIVRLAIAAMQFCTILFPSVAMGQSGGFRVKGNVTSKSGTPVSGVGIFGDPSTGQEAKTDSNGSFELPSNPGETLHFWKEGFRPKTLILKPSDTRLRVILLEESPPFWRVSECPTSKDHEVSLPFLPSFIVPTEAKIEKFSDVDYGKSAIAFTDNSRPLELWWGLIKKPEIRERLLISDSTVIEERWIHKTKGAFGTDIRGQTTGGMYWRYTDFPVGFAIYEGVSAESAELYDRIIDSACFPRK